MMMMMMMMMMISLSTNTPWWFTNITYPVFLVTVNHGAEINQDDWNVNFSFKKGGKEPQILHMSQPGRVFFVLTAFLVDFF